MIAFKETKGRLKPPRFGEIPGVRIGSEWHGRGEVAIVGLHTQMMRVRGARGGAEPRQVAHASGGAARGLVLHELRVMKWAASL
jgi:hypothetical protein